MGFKLTALSLLLFLIYLCIGSIIFYFIEHNIEIQRKQEIKKAYTDLGQIDCMRFGDFEEILRLAWSFPATSFNSMDPSNNATANSWQWDPIGSFFFSFVVLTTIGFGNQAPTTISGQAAVIIFSLIGIPICLNTISHLSSTMKQMIYKLESCLPLSLKKHNLIIGCIFAAIIFTIIFLIPSAFLSLGEDWSYHEALYFAFITLSTIGFGDYIAGTKQPDYCQLLLALWMLIGLVYVSTMISFIQIMLDKLSNYVTEKKVVPFITEKKSKPHGEQDDRIPQAHAMITGTERRPNPQHHAHVKRTIKTPTPIDRRRKY